MAGPTGAGKMALVRDIIINKSEVIEKPVDRIFYYYKVWQPMYDELLEKVPNIKFETELPNREPEPSEPGHCSIAVMDDLSNELYSKDSSFQILQWFKCYSHHCNFVLFFSSQNVFESARFQRTLSLNSTYIILFRNLRDSEQVKRLARQIYTDKAKLFMQVYNKVMHSPHRHLVVDLHLCSEHPLGIFSNIIPNNESQEDKDFERAFILRPV